MDEEQKNQIAKLEAEISVERDRLSTDRMDISYGELINLYKADELLIRPEYQRLFRWNVKQKTALIESILLSIPIPPIFVAEDKEGVWELVDGLQRVSTIVSFFGELKEDLTAIKYDDPEIGSDVEIEDDLSFINNWKLEAGGLIPSLEGLDINTLPSRFRINLKRAACRVEILRGESNISMKYELFKRLNSGGSKLKPQEIRNAIYRGINPVVNELLLRLSGWNPFQKLTSLSSPKKQELYDQELVLRFIALYNNQDRINDNLENFLNHFMEQAVSSPEFNDKEFEGLFKEVIEMICDVGNQTVFRNDRGLFVPALFEGITIGTAQNIKRFRDDKELLKSKIEEIKGDKEFKDSSGSASNSKYRIRNRLKRANDIFQA